ncbi:MAG: DUF4349 domain-containing protein [Lachnospiraceae bacterium]|nr:DUF4349 domain-containing protein [Lachnospiraceae bacterium]
MKKKIGMRTMLAVFTAAALCTACGSAGKGMTSSYEMAAAADAGGVYSNSAAYYDVAEAEYIHNEAAVTADYDYEYAEAAAAEEPIAEEGSVSVPEGAVDRKLIKTVNISAETEAFDELVPQLQKRVEELGGYIESISVYDIGSYYVEDAMQKQRCAQITARVPKEALDGFLAQVGEQTNVTSRSENVEDVTLQYVDLDSHKKVLLTEQERLLALMEQAESVEDIITIEGRLSEVRYQIESMESQLRTYDNKIDYSTVYLSIEEVRKYSAPQTATVWQRIGTGFMKSLENIGFGIRDFAIYFVIDLPYIILGLLGIVVAFFVLRALFKRFLRSKFLKKTLQKGRNLSSSLRKKDVNEESGDGEETGSDSETKEEQE